MRRGRVVFRLDSAAANGVGDCHAGNSFDWRGQDDPVFGGGRRHDQSERDLAGFGGFDQHERPVYSADNGRDGNDNGDERGFAFGECDVSSDGDEGFGGRAYGQSAERYAEFWRSTAIYGFGDGFDQYRSQLDRVRWFHYAGGAIHGAEHRGHGHHHRDESGGQLGVVHRHRCRAE